MEVRSLQPSEFKQAKLFYANFDYIWEPIMTDYDVCAFIDKRIIGVARIAKENDSNVLRGMFIHEEHQRKGVGSKILQVVDTQLQENECWCLPFLRLQNFYAQIGFQVVDSANAPRFLSERLKQMSDNFEGLIIMKRG